MFCVNDFGFYSKYFQPTPGSLHSLPHYSVMSHPRGHHVSSYFRLPEHAEESESGNASRRSPSFNDSVMSDSNYDSGAFSRNSSPTCHRSRVSTPEPVATPEILSTPRGDKFHRYVSPLVSPPLVLSVTRQSRVRTCHVTRPETVSSGRGPMSASPVTVSIGASTRLCINDNDKYQSLPNLAMLKRSDTRLGLGGVHPAGTGTAVKMMTKMPHMGTSRLTTPPKPPRVRSVMMMSNSHSSLERPRISTSTAALLTRSNTSVGVYKEQDRSPSFPRSARDGSCGSDTSSGVFSVASVSSSDHDAPSMGPPQHYRVTVNGQHLDTLWSLVVRNGLVLSWCFNEVMPWRHSVRDIYLSLSSNISNNNSICIWSVTCQQSQSCHKHFSRIQQYWWTGPNLDIIDVKVPY